MNAFVQMSLRLCDGGEGGGGQAACAGQGWQGDVKQGRAGSECDGKISQGQAGQVTWQVQHVAWLISCPLFELRTCSRVWQNRSDLIPPFFFKLFSHFAKTPNFPSY